MWNKLKKRRSEIIDEINGRSGKNYDNDVVVKAYITDSSFLLLIMRISIISEEKQI